MGARCYSLFVPEAIPRAVKTSNQRLSAALRDHLGPVAWGNTNSKAGDFKGVRELVMCFVGCGGDGMPLPFVHAPNTTPCPFPSKIQALRAAEAYGRRAVLLRWGQELERVSLEELLVRNALRATRLGRYIPAVSVKVCRC